MSIYNILEKLNHRPNKFLTKFSKTSKIIFFFIFIVSLIFFANKILAIDNIVKDTQDAQEVKNNAESWQENAWNTTAVNALTTLTGKLNFNTDGSASKSVLKLLSPFKPQFPKLSLLSLWLLFLMPLPVLLLILAI